MGIKLNGSRCEEIKRAVAKMFVEYSITCVPISGFEIAVKMGIKVTRYSAYSKEIRAILFKESSDGFSMMVDDQWYIFYNDEKSYKRINFTIMHEIGHIVLDHTEDSELAKKEADFFAKFALAPPVLIHRMKLETAEAISDIFGISYEAAGYALSYYQKWLKYGGHDYKDYEIRMLRLFDLAV